MNSVKLQDTKLVYRNLLQKKKKKSVAFLYTNNEEAEREIKKTTPLTVAPKIIKFLEINLTKEVEDPLKTIKHDERH